MEFDISAGALGAMGWGMLTAISPCPMATNIAAMSFIGKRITQPGTVFLSGLLYTAGRTIAYAGLAFLLVKGVLSIPQTSAVLEKYVNLALGPLLILIGMVLLELIRFNIGGGGVSEKMQKRVERLGVWAAAPLGFIFALSFCPISAAYFFFLVKSLIDHEKSGVALPTFYGIGTALPVIIFAGLIAAGAKSIGKVFNKLTQIERWARRVTGVIFIGVGIYYCLGHIFNVNVFWWMKNTN